MQDILVILLKIKIGFMGFELDEDYFKASVKRFEQYIAQKSLF